MTTELKNQQWFNEKGQIICLHTPFKIDTLESCTNPYFNRSYCHGCDQYIDGYGQPLDLESLQ